MNGIALFLPKEVVSVVYGIIMVLNIFIMLKYLAPQYRQAYARSSTIREVECFEPYSAYHVLNGAVDLMGVHFLCHAEGILLEEGDNSDEVKWISLDELKDMIEQKDCFSCSDELAALSYLNEYGRG